MKITKKLYKYIFAITRRLAGIIYIPRFVFNFLLYRYHSNEIVSLSNLYPCLTDWVPNTPFDPHYFYQGAWLARSLMLNPPPMRHIDIGSDVRVIATISAFIPVDFIDFRPLKVMLSNLRCLQGNITCLEYPNGSINSISSLHVVEHIGLGRYGDSIDVEGGIRAINEMKRVLALHGRLYISVPVGRERVCFNAHRVFNPETIIRLFEPLRLLSFALVDDLGNFSEEASLKFAATQDYACGLFVFTRD